MPPNKGFLPTASLETLKKRAQLLEQLRAFFRARDVLEVEVPVLGEVAVTDVYLSALKTKLGDRQFALQTSPEFYMKRLLAAGSESIFYLGKSFRADELGHRHSPEFTMLEWYRVGLNDRELREEMQQLFHLLAPEMTCSQHSYGEIFQKFTQINPHSATASQLRNFALAHIDLDWHDDDKSLWLDLIFSHLIEPNLEAHFPDSFVFIYDYPQCQSALAKIENNKNDERVAKRFEVFCRGIELANGYWELTDAGEQRARFEKDNQQRKIKGLPEIEVDEKLMAALEFGLPECAGVALGVDRLLMCLLGVRHIKNVQAFYDF